MCIKEKDFKKKLKSPLPPLPFTPLPLAIHSTIQMWYTESSIKQKANTKPLTTFLWLLTASVSVSVWVWVIWWITNQWHLEVWQFLIQQHFRVQTLPINNLADSYGKPQILNLAMWHYYLSAELWIIILLIWWFIIQQVNNKENSNSNWNRNWGYFLSPFFLSDTLSSKTHTDKWEVVQDLCMAMNQSEA